MNELVNQLFKRIASGGIIVIVLIAGFLLGNYTTPKITTTYSTTIYETTTATDCSVPEESLIGFGKGIGGFSYKRIELDTLKEGESIAFKGVTFTNLPLNHTYTGCIVQFFKFSFPDGTSEVQQITLCPTTFEPKVYFTDHTNPRAGVIYSLGHSPVVRGIHLIVRD